MHLLSNGEPALDWDSYCALPAEGRLEWERRADALTQGMFFIMNSKNEIAKKDPQLAYSQGNHTAYLTDIESPARYLTTQYPNIPPGNHRKKNKQRKADDPKSEDKDNVTSGTAGAHVEDSTTNGDTTAPSGEAGVTSQKQAKQHPLHCVW